MSIRVEELASRAGVSVDTVRFYQKQRLLPPPRREGRVAWYDDDHLALHGSDRLDRAPVDECRPASRAVHYDRRADSAGRFVAR